MFANKSVNFYTDQELINKFVQIFEQVLWFPDKKSREIPWYICKPVCFKTEQKTTKVCLI